MISSEQITRRWLSGTTCTPRCKPTIVWESGGYVLLHHYAHSTYVDRTYLGPVNCEAYTALFTRAQCETREFDALLKPLRTWPGRWSKAKLAEALEFISTSAGGSATAL